MLRNHPSSFQAAVKLRAKGIGTVTGRLIVGTAERIPPAELVDTTGAGDSFIGAILYGMKFTEIHVLFHILSCT